LTTLTSVIKSYQTIQVYYYYNQKTDNIFMLLNTVFNIIPASGIASYTCSFFVSTPYGLSESCLTHQLLSTALSVSNLLHLTV
jgi:hypothetical protein